MEDEGKRQNFIKPGDEGFGQGCIYGCFGLTSGGFIMGGSGAYIGAKNFGWAGALIGGLVGGAAGIAGGLYLGGKIVSDETNKRCYNINLPPYRTEFASHLIDSLRNYFDNKTDKKILGISGDSDAMHYGTIQHYLFFEPKNAFLRLNRILPWRKRIILDICYGGNSGYINIDSYDSNLVPKKDLVEVIKFTEDKIFESKDENRSKEKDISETLKVVKELSEEFEDRLDAGEDHGKLMEEINKRLRDRLQP